jgi:hypothetical protein
MIKGINTFTRRSREMDGRAIENEYRESKGLKQTQTYISEDITINQVPQFNKSNSKFYVPIMFNLIINYRIRK